jgi:hypothetical protein
VIRHLRQEANVDEVRELPRALQQVFLDIVLLQVHESRVLVAIFGQKVEGVDLAVTVEQAPDFPRRAFFQHPLSDAEPVEDLERPLGPADRPGADGDHVVVIENNARHTTLREVYRHGKANGPRANDRDRCFCRAAVKLRRPDEGLFGVGICGHLILPRRALARVLRGCRNTSVFKKEVVELRRVNARVVQLHMRLAAVVHLVLKEMRKQVADPLGRRSLAAFGFDTAVEIGIAKAHAEGQQTRVRGGLRGPKLRHILDCLTVVDRPAQATLHQGIDIVEINLVDVVERGRERREETRPLGHEILGGEVT